MSPRNNAMKWSAIVLLACASPVILAAPSVSDTPSSGIAVDVMETDFIDTMDASDELSFESGPEMLLFMDIPVVIAGSLTATDLRTAPSTITTITAEDIRSSGARSLYELLEIMVPNLQMILHPVKARHLGLRGINGTRDDKYLLVVNGRVMNEHTDYGVMSERDLPMLRDIHHIDVVRGSGSALYGPGALAMVVNIVTESAETFQGFEIATRVGAIEEYYASEFKFGHKFKNGAGLFLYGGVADYPGAPLDKAPLYYGADTTKGGVTYPGSEPVTHDVKRYNAAYGGRPKMKFHTLYTQENMEAGFRYTQGGEYMELSKADEIDVLLGQGYRQGTLFWGYKQKVNPDFSILYDVNYDRTDVVSGPATAVRYNNYREDKYFAKVIANWDISQSHHFAFGGAWSHEEYGLPPTDNDGKQVKMYRMAGTMPRWSTDLRSVLGEYQWNVNEQWTAFFGARLDDHTFTDHMFSPRGTVVYTPNDKDTFKLMASRAVRTNTGTDMKNEDLRGNPNSDVEVLDAFELRHEHKFNENLWMGACVFHHSQDLIGWGRTPTNGDGMPMILGNIKSWGLEVEGTYKKDKLRLDLSHGYTKMTEFNTVEGLLSVEESAGPLGYGNDLANWFDHITKARLHYSITEKWNVDSSLVVYWFNPGGEDFAKWKNSTDATTYDLGFDKAFEPSYFLNLGLQYKHNENWTVRFDAYDVLGWFDEDLNTTRYGYNNTRPGTYRIRPPSVGIELVYTF